MLDWVRGLLTRAKPAAAGRRYSRADLLRYGSSVKARYDAAQTTDENTRLWSQTDVLSARAANSYQVRSVLRRRARYEIANNSYARGITLTLANDLIGTGPRLQLRTADPDANRQVEQAWAQWAAAIGLSEKLHLLCLGKIGDGEGFGLLVNNDRLGGTAQLDVQVIEADQVTTPTLGFTTNTWIDGVELDERGDPAVYHVLKTHPGDLFFQTLNPLEYDRVPARKVLHWFRKDRPGQVRGIPEITPAVELFAKLRRFTQAVLASAETAADFAGMLESEAPADGGTEDPTPFETLAIERGMLTTLPAGSKLSQLRAEQPATTYEMFVRLLIREICRCLNIPLNVGLGDSSGYNYSSGRLDHMVYHRGHRIDRARCEVLLDRLFAAWLDESVMIPGLLPAGLNVSAVPHRWFWPGVESIDPVKDATANQLELETNTTTLADVYAERGEDWEEALRQRAKEKDLEKELGLVEPPPPPDPPGGGKPMAAALRAFLRAYDPDQARDDDGKFAGDGSAQDAAHAQQEQELAARHGQEEAAHDQARAAADQELQDRHEGEQDAHDRERKAADGQLEDRQGDEASALERRQERESDRLDNKHGREDHQVERAREKEDRLTERGRAKEDARVDDRREREDRPQQRQVDREFDGEWQEMRQRHAAAEDADRAKVKEAADRHGANSPEHREEYETARDRQAARSKETLGLGQRMDARRDELTRDKQPARAAEDKATADRRAAEDRAAAGRRDAEDQGRQARQAAERQALGDRHWQEESGLGDRHVAEADAHAAEWDRRGQALADRHQAERQAHEGAWERRGDELAQRHAGERDALDARQQAERDAAEEVTHAG
jgi:lambda family phage portal protein